MDRQTEWTDEQNARKRIKHAKDKKKKLGQDENIPKGKERILYNCFILWNRLIRNKNLINKTR